MFAVVDKIIFVEVEMRERVSTFRAFYEQLVNMNVIPLRLFKIGPWSLRALFRLSDKEKICEVAKNLKIELELYSGDC